MTKQFDLIIRDARIIDGSGNPCFKSDIGIAKGKIALISRNIVADSAETEIRADRQIVCPGFIDTHTHDDLYLLAKPMCDDKILQGVTTVVVGNCGLSIAPISEEHEAEIKMFFNAAGGKHLKKDDLHIRSFDDYLKKLEDSGPGINVMSLVGHTTIRVAVMGMENRTPTEDELEKMKTLVAESMKSGACGISTGLIQSPGNFADAGEIAELAKVVARFNGIYATHLRSEGNDIFPALEEALKIGEMANLPVHVSHHKVVGKHNWGLSAGTLDAFEKAREKFMDVTCDQYPYRAGSTFLCAALPPSALAEGEKLFTELLKDPTYRASLVETFETRSEKGWENLVKGAGFDGTVISIAPQHESYIGKSIGEIAKAENRNPYDVLFDILMVEKLDAFAIYFIVGEDDIVRIMQTPLSMIGSDGIPGFGVERVHPRQSGTFPRILGRYVREKKAITLEEAIRKMTSFPAQTFGLRQKGLLKERFDADLVIFDPDTILDTATYDDPNRVPEGISHVIVNGRIAVEKGYVTGATSGTVLKYGINT